MENYVYILKSTISNWYYVGFTNNLEARFDQHNTGRVKSTKFYKPFKLVFVQIVNSRPGARNLEKFLKIRFNKEAFLEILDC